MHVDIYFKLVEQRDDLYQSIKIPGQTQRICTNVNILQAYYMYMYMDIEFFRNPHPTICTDRYRFTVSRYDITKKAGRKVFGTTACTCTAYRYVVYYMYM